MTQITLHGNPVNTSGELPSVGADAPGFTLTKADLSSVSKEDLAGQKVVLNIFPSVDTPTCASSVRAFNEKAASLDNTAVVCVSADLPFAFSRFCGAEGIENVTTASTFKNPEFMDNFGVKIIDGALSGLCARAVVVLDADGKVTYTELVSEIGDEPDYESALAAL